MTLTRLSQDGPTALYRYFDAGDRLLYVGVSNNIGSRILNHISRSRWMDLAVRSTIERHPTRRRALIAERAAIEAEHPLFNIQHNDTPAARKRLRAYLEEIGRIDLLRPQSRNVPPGELDQPKRWQPEDKDPEYEPRIAVHAQQVIDVGVVTLHVSDGAGFGEVYLSGTEARDLAELLLQRAAEAQGPATRSPDLAGLQLAG